MKKKIFSTLIFSFLLAISIILSSFSVVQSASAQTIPTLVPYVNDFAGVIDASYEDQINNYAAELEASTTAEIAVLTVDSIQPMSIEMYAVEVFEKNGIGQKGNDNGILIVAAIEDRRWRIEVGYGLEGDINDAKAGRIGRAYITPYFQEEKYGEGLYLTVKTLGDIISGNETLSGQFDVSPGHDPEGWILVMILFILLIGLIIPLIFLIKRQRCPKCKSWMRVEHRAKKICFICDKCGYKKCYKRKRRHSYFLFVGGGGGGVRGGGGGFGGGSSGGGGASGGW